MKTITHLVAGAAAVGLAGVALSGSAQAAGNCAGFKSFSVPNHTIEITKAEELPAGKISETNNPGTPPGAALPARCLIEGMIDSRTGAEGRSYGIGFTVALPDDWNGRFLFQGGGGRDGILRDPLGPVAAGDEPALSRGFAVAGTDSGHQSKQVFESFFDADQQAVMDFEYASIGVVTDIAKQIVNTYYGKPAAYSYFTGCSMGGREAMISTQRYARQFDGAIAGSPAMEVGWSGIGDKWVSTMLNTVAPKGPDGKPDVNKIFSAGEKKTIIGGILEACDAKDGLKDGMIFNVAQCNFDPHMLVCKGAKTDSCLTEDQANAIERGMAGPKDSKGNQVYPGFYYDTGLAAQRPIPGLLNPGPAPVGGTNYQTSMDVDAEAAAADANPANRIGDTNRWVLLNTFYQKGGKLLFFHGVSDPWFSAQDTVGYYKRMAAANGGMDKVRAENSRLFLVPGMGHCRGGEATLDNFDLLSKLVDWVEKGKAPDSVVATGQFLPGRSRPLCAYPKHAQYTGKGDPQKAENFTCAE